MNIFKLSWRNLLDKPLNTALSLLLLTLGVSIISLLLLLNEQLTQTFNRNIQGIDMVVGAKGSPLSLILSAVYHIDSPTGNIPLEEAESLSKHPLVAKAIPLAYGDSYRGYRILGTDTQYVAHYGAALVTGRLFEDKYEVVLGATAAARLQLTPGQEFFGSHGLLNDSDVHDDAAYKIVGILGPTGTVIDQMLLTPVSSVWAVHAHEEEPAEGAEDEADEHDHDHDDAADHSEHDHAEEENREITALLIKFRSPLAMVTLPRMVNTQTSMQAALPAIEINKLLNRLLPIAINTAQGIALAIIVISGISVFISLFNSLKARKYELALMRSMGASRAQVFWMVVLEGLMLAGLGGLLGLIMSRLGLWLLNQQVVQDYHYALDVMTFLPEEGLLLMLTLLIGFLAAALPGLRAFGLNISATLAEG